MRNQQAERLVDAVWGRALDRILREGSVPAMRSSLGDEISLLVPQVETAALLARNPAFAKLLYTSAQDAASRNTYLILRRLGMPTDFFWKFDSWTNDHAFETFNRIVARVFSTLMSVHKAGQLSLDRVDVAGANFELSFASCAECAGLRCSTGMCYFHAGAFAGVFEAMLDRRFDAIETECRAAGAESCRFVVAPQDDRAIAGRLEAWWETDSPDSPAVERWSTGVASDPARALGDMIDVNYYQLMLASAFLPNLDLVEQACFDSGVEIGRSLAKEAPGGSVEAVVERYRLLRYTNVAMQPDGDGYRVEIAEIPEVAGPLSGAALVPFISGEVAGVLSTVTGTEFSVAETLVMGETLALQLSPKT